MRTSCSFTRINLQNNEEKEPIFYDNKVKTLEVENLLH